MTCRCSCHSWSTTTRRGPGSISWWMWKRIAKGSWSLRCEIFFLLLACWKIRIKQFAVLLHCPKFLALDDQTEAAHQITRRSTRCHDGRSETRRRQSENAAWCQIIGRLSMMEGSVVAQKTALPPRPPEDGKDAPRNSHLGRAVETGGLCRRCDRHPPPFLWWQPLVHVGHKPVPWSR